MAGMHRALFIGREAPAQHVLHANLALAADFAVSRCGVSVDSVRSLPAEPAPHLVVYTDEPGGYSAANAARLRWGKARLVQTTQDASSAALFSAARHGAFALVDVSAEVDTVRALLRQVAAGQRAINEQIMADATVVAQLLDLVRGETTGAAFADAESVSTEPLVQPLTLRELQLLERAAQGFGNRRIAQDVGLSEQTIKNRFSGILDKLGVADRTEAVVYAIRKGWIAFDRPRLGG